MTSVTLPLHVTLLGIETSLALHFLFLFVFFTCNPFGY